MGVTNRIAFAWGLAEATQFFVVPDVWLTLAARRRLRPGLVAALHALAGALLGGTAMYLWGQRRGVEALAAVLAVPAIDAPMAAWVAEALRTQGEVAVLWGPLKGVPYKLYAVQAAAAGVPLAGFLLISVPARLVRFLLVTTIAHYGLRLLARWRFPVTDTTVLIVCWVSFYAWYFSTMGVF